MHFNHIQFFAQFMIKLIQAILYELSVNIEQYIPGRPIEFLALAGSQTIPGANIVPIKHQFQPVNLLNNNDCYA
jgi:hypothetical protein